MSNIDVKALFDKLAECKNAIIVGHSHPDGDCVGSAVSLACLIEALGGKAEVIFPEKAPARLAFLLGERKELDELPENLDGYKIICVDLASPVQMASLREAVEPRADLRIDHHMTGASYAAYEAVEPNAAAAGELIFDLWEHAMATGAVKQIPAKALTATFGAISSDTGCFKYANVTPKTHIRAAKLIEMGANAAEINRLLFDTKTETQLKAEAIALANLEVFACGKIAAIGVDLSDYGETLNIKDFETAIDFARSVSGSKCAVVAKASPTVGVFRVSIRSNDDTDVSKVAAVFGGGGHIRAAGCSVNAASAKEALGMVIAELEKVI